MENFYAGLFIELKNSALFLVSFNFEFINSKLKETKNNAECFNSMNKPA